MHDSREAVGGGLGTDALPHEIFLQGKERTCRYGGHNETQASLEDHLRTSSSHILEWTVFMVSVIAAVIIPWNTWRVARSTKSVK